MSPLNVTILLHVYAIVADYRDCTANVNHARSEAVRYAFDQFARDGLIEKIHSDEAWNATTSSERSSQYKITAKGEAMVDAICAVQTPICKWVQPCT